MPDSPASDWKCLDCGHLWHGYSHEHAHQAPANNIEEINPRSRSMIVKHFGFYSWGDVGQPMRELAELMDSLLLDGPEKSAGLRKLLEARDCFVRARSEGKRG